MCYFFHLLHFTMTSPKKKKNLKPLHCVQHIYHLGKVCLMEKENGKAVSFSLQHFLPEICLRHTKREFIVHSILTANEKNGFLRPHSNRRPWQKESYKLVLETVRVYFFLFLNWIWLKCFWNRTCAFDEFLECVLKHKFSRLCSEFENLNKYELVFSEVT